MTKPKRHHFVPRFLLDRFCQDGLLWVYDRARDDFRRQQPLNTAVIKDYYSTTDDSGDKDVSVEEMLSTLEGAAKPAIDKLDRREVLTDEEREHLALFVAILDTRVPEFERSVDELTQGIAKRLAKTAFADAGRARAIMARMERDTGKTTNVTPEDLVAFIQDDSRYTIKTNRNASLAMQIGAALQMAPLLLNMDWWVLHAPAKKSFVVTDNPFVLIAPPERQPGLYGVGVLTPGARKFVPLGATTALLIGEPGHELRHLDIPEEAVRGLNLNATASAEDYAFARDERLLRSLVAATRLARKERQSKVQFG